jgi:hypothetical protein
MDVAQFYINLDERDFAEMTPEELCVNGERGEIRFLYDLSGSVIEPQLRLVDKWGASVASFLDVYGELGDLKVRSILKATGGDATRIFEDVCYIAYQIPCIVDFLRDRYKGTEKEILVEAPCVALEKYFAQRVFSS